MDTEQKPKKNFCNHKLYQKNKREIVKYRGETHRTQHIKNIENSKVCKGTLTLYFDQDFFFLCILYIMDALMGKEKCKRCDVLKNVLDEMGIRYPKKRSVYITCIEQPIR